MAQPRIAEKTKRIICEGDTFYQKTVINGIDTILVVNPYHPYKPEKCTRHNDIPLFKYVEHMPLADYDVNDHLKREIQAYTQAKNIIINGDLVFSFIISKTGAVEQVKIPVNSSQTVDNEDIIRIIQNMPKWTPGIQSGRPVDVILTSTVLTLTNIHTSLSNYYAGILEACSLMRYYRDRTI